MTITQVYGRIKFVIPKDSDRVEFVLPGGDIQTALPYWHCDADFTYDFHGYETVTLIGDSFKQVAFTATKEGEHILFAYCGGILLEKTTFTAEYASLPGFVEVSERDPRYFALTGGESYVPIGPNLVGCGYDLLPAGTQHFTTSERTATTGMIEWRRWFTQMKASGANYCRIWLSNRYTEARTEVMGVHDPVALARFDALVELARECGVRVKFCMEHWRTFTDTGNFAYRRYIDPDTGMQMTDRNEWFESPVWNARWLKDVEPYLARCQNDPVVFAWELWNEINNCADDFNTVANFTARMLPEFKRISPRNLVVNSIGSYDSERGTFKYDIFREMPEMEFQQVHRYLDQGAPFEICHTDPVEFTIDAVNRTRRPDKPILFTETGAVNDRHTGPFRFYNCDHDGLIFIDTTYPALFAGAAGSGHIWHWNEYVETKNLWRLFRPISDAVEGIQMDTEGFVPGIIENIDAWILTLTGKSHTLILVRNRSDRWDKVLRDAQIPGPIDNLIINIKAKSAKAYWIIDKLPEDVVVDDIGLRLPSFVHGCVIKVVNG